MVFFRFTRSLGCVSDGVHGDEAMAGVESGCKVEIFRSARGASRYG